VAREFTMLPIGRFAEVFSGYAFKSEDFSDIGVPVIKIKNVNNREVDLSATDYFPEEKVTEKHSRFFLQDRDVLIAMTGQGSVGRVGRIRLRGNSRVLLNQRVGKFVTDPSKLDLAYLFYVISTPSYEQRLFDAGSGSGQPNLSPSIICSMEIPVPPISEQRAIAHILGTLDDKIELNRRMNETLEAMARAIFKSWFVDFDPVRAKMEGRWKRSQSLPGLPAHLYDLFPDRFVSSELGVIPEGWEVKSLDEVAQFLNGLALQKFPPKESRSLPVIKIAQLRAGSVNGADRASADLDPDYIVTDGDVLFSWSGSLECVLWAGGPGALNQHLFKVTSDGYPKWLYYLGIHQHLDDFRHIAAGKATTMGHIQRHHLAGAKLPIPSPELLEVMDRIIQPMVENTWRRAVQSRTLAALRNTLLPKLISGELRVGQESRSTTSV
jgi:type I restriction enzyme, S subunit